MTLKKGKSRESDSEYENLDTNNSNGLKVYTTKLTVSYVTTVMYICYYYKLILPQLMSSRLTKM